MFVQLKFYKNNEIKYLIKLINFLINFNWFFETHENVLRLWGNILKDVSTLQRAATAYVDERKLMN